jgi:hypothetical protein
MEVAMGRALAKIGDRMLAAVLPHTTAAGCQGKSYSECQYLKSRNSNREMTSIVYKID